MLPIASRAVEESAAPTSLDLLTRLELAALAMPTTAPMTGTEPAMSSASFHW